MKLKNKLLGCISAAALLSATSLTAQPLYINVGNIGDGSYAGDQTQADVDSYISTLISPTSTLTEKVNANVALTNGDTDTLTGLFDTLSFALDTNDLLTADSSNEDGITRITLDGIVLNTPGETEGIGEGVTVIPDSTITIPGVGDFFIAGSTTGVTLDIVWGNTIGSAISFSFTDHNDGSTITDVIIATGEILSITSSLVEASFDDFATGVWFDENDNDVSTFAQSKPLLLSFASVLNFDSVDARLVPEPSVLVLMGLGLLGMGLASRRKKK